MITVYAVQLSDYINQTDRKPDWMLRYFDLPKLRPLADQWRSVLGRLLVLTYYQSIGESVRNLQFQYSDKGKPYIPDTAVHFSISHSGDYVCAVFADCETGIDIEVVKEDNTAIARRFFGNDEFAYMQERDSQSRFYEVWCSKEAYLKLLGTGLLKSLSDIELCVLPDHTMYMRDQDKMSAISNRIHILRELPGHIISVCASTNSKPVLRQIKAEEINIVLQMISRKH